MREAPIPPNEAKRLAALWALEMLDSEPEARFDRITMLAAKTLTIPISTLTLVDSSREWFKSAHGITERESPRAFSFCGHAILQEDPLIVNDALEDERFSGNPLVKGGIRFYAGKSLKGPVGQRVGSFCVKDVRPRTLTSEEMEVFCAFAGWAEFELNFGCQRETFLHMELEERLSELAKKLEALADAPTPKVFERRPHPHDRWT